jgi:hypothetical protein
LRITFAELGAEVLTAVAGVVDLRLDPEVKVLVIVPQGEKMADLRTAADEDSVPHFRFGIVLGMSFAARQISAVEQ